MTTRSREERSANTSHSLTSAEYVTRGRMQCCTNKLMLCRVAVMPFRQVVA